MKFLKATLLVIFFILALGLFALVLYLSITLLGGIKIILISFGTAFIYFMYEIAYALINKKITQDDKDQDKV